MYDVVIIGSGAGGAPVAHTLVRSQKQLQVLVLEKGPFWKPQSDTGVSDFKRDELFATGPEKRINVPGVVNNGDAYFTSHVEPDVNDEPHVYRDAQGKDRATLEGYTAQVVGGGTQLYGGVSLRFAPVDFALKSFNEGRGDLKEDPGGDVKREARDWPIQYSDLEPYYSKAEALVGISGTVENQAKPFSADNYQPPRETNGISIYVERGMDALKMPRYRTPLAVITRDHAPSGRKAGDAKTGFVNRYGDPLGLKSNTWVSLLRPVSNQPNFELRCNCSVTRLENTGAAVTRVHFFDEGGEPQFVDAKVVVVSCSAIESVRLLKLSAREGSDFDRRIHSTLPSGSKKDLLGRYFLTHCFGGAETVMPGRFDKSLSVDSDWATDFCTSPEFLRSNGLWAGGAIYNNTSAHALPISLLRTYGAMDIDSIWQGFVRRSDLRSDGMIGYFDGNFGRQLSVSFMANQLPLPTNRIELHPSIVDKWNRPTAYIIKDWHSHDRYLMGVLAEKCREVLAWGGDPQSGSFPVEGSGGVHLAENGIVRIANHILGGARFGAKEEDSVLDANCRVWGFDNLYVTDGSWMPTSGSANPTLTIQANAFRVADHIESLF